MIALFREHATARLRGNAAEAQRLAARIGDTERVLHLLFLLALLGQAVVEEFGTHPDPDDLAELTKHLHEKHFPANPTFVALRAEAMIRGVCQEPTLILEIPNNEQPGYVWSVLSELIDPSATDTELAERFDEAERAHLDLLAVAAESPLLTPQTSSHQPPVPSTRPGEPTTEPSLPDTKETA
jgi:hypothetical protein